MKLQYSSSFGVLSFLWAESQGYRCECFNFLLLFWSSLFQLNIYSVQEALRRGKDNASKVAGKLSSGCTWLSKEFQHLSVCLFTDICVCMCLLQGLKCSLTAGGEAIVEVLLLLLWNIWCYCLVEQVWFYVLFKTETKESHLVEWLFTNHLYN